MEEEWRSIEGWEGRYDVSNTGRVRSRAYIQERPHAKAGGKQRRCPERIRKPAVDSHGYLQVSLSEGPRRSRLRVLPLVHRLVAKAFIPNPDNHPEVNHRNGNTRDNRVENLEWCTRQQNASHALKLPSHQRRCGEGHKNARLTWDIVNWIRAVHIPGDSEFGVSALARKAGVPPPSVSFILSYKSWRPSWFNAPSHNVPESHAGAGTLHRAPPN